MVRIEIDEQEIEIADGSMIIEAADQHGINIPRFCYHKKLSIAANCRMCLVEVDRFTKPLPACATPVSEGMKIKTKSKLAIESQRSVMEFLLINHPLDCPICDQGGECELQDLSIIYGRDIARFSENKRVLKNDNLGSLISTDMTRCIHCTRCIRFGKEIAGFRELGATGRGEMMQIGTFIEHNITSEISGNVIDLCPVGALTSKPFRFRARAWELSVAHGIAAHDCLGSNIEFHIRSNQIMRVAPRENEGINEVWLSDRDRFSYQGLLTEDRLAQPILKKNGNWEEIDWSQALAFVNENFRNIVDIHNPNNIGALISPSATIEEYYLLQAYMRKLGSSNIDHRLRQQDFCYQEMAPIYPGLNINLAMIEELDALLVIGSDIHKELPLLAVRLRKMVNQGGKVFIINPVDFNCNFEVDNKNKYIIASNKWLEVLAGIAKALLINTNINYTCDIPEGAEKLLQDIVPTDIDVKQAKALLNSKKSCILLGQLSLMHPDASKLIAIANLIAILLKAPFGTLNDGANSAGAWLAGCVPHRLPAGKISEFIGLDAFSMLQTPLKGYVLFGIEPEFDSLLGAQALETLDKAECVIALTAYKSPGLMEVADLLLPITPFSETDGTYINCMGSWQSVQAAVKPFANSKPGWKILRMIGNFTYQSNTEIVNEIKDLLHLNNITNKSAAKWEWFCPANLDSSILDLNDEAGLIRIAPVPLYAIDAIVRRAYALQNTPDAINNAYIQINAKTASNLKIEEGDMVRVCNGGFCLMEVKINQSIPENSALIYQSKQETLSLGLPYSKVKIEKS